MSKNSYKINEVFNSKGMPEFTYVHRDNGENERQLYDSIYNDEICLISGLSKTGKSVLYQKVIVENNRKAVIISCLSQNIKEIWLEALDEINACRSNSVTKTNLDKISGKFQFNTEVGWNVIFKASGGGETGAEHSYSEAEAYEMIRSEPGVNYLAPALYENNIILVIEELQNLDKSTFESVIKGCKTINGKGVSIIIIYTSNHIDDIENSNKSLSGKISYLDNKLWAFQDLKAIIDKGMDLINVPIDDSLKKIIAEESVGLPQVTQVLCRELLILKAGKRELNNLEASKLSFTLEDVFTVFYNYANKYLKSYSEYYKTIIDYKNTTKYLNLKEIILNIFKDDHIKNSIDVNFIIAFFNSCNLKNYNPPTKDEIISEIEGLAKINRDRNLNLVDWNAKYEILLLIDPLFLFFLRWNNKERGIERTMKRMQEDIDLDDAIKED